jgi:hypothetical protein
MAQAQALKSNGLLLYNTFLLIFESSVDAEPSATGPTCLKLGVQLVQFIPELTNGQVQARFERAYSAWTSPEDGADTNHPPLGLFPIPINFTKQS